MPAHSAHPGPVERPALLAAVALLSLALVTGLLVGGCGQSAPAMSEGPQPSPTAGAVQSPEPTSPPADLPASSLLTVTVWTTEEFSPTHPSPASQIVVQTAADVEATKPGVQFRFVLKLPYGKGGILDYLLTTGAVVPELLPALAFIDVDEIGEAVRAGLVQPLDALLPAELVADLFPVARGACTIEGKLYCLQFQADLDHVVYNPNKMSQPPRSWTEVLSRPGPYLFPAGGRGGLVNDAFLVDYLAVRADSEGSESEKPFLEEKNLAAVLKFYRDGMSQGVFPASILEYHSSDDSWRDFLAGQGAMAQVSARRYLAERDRAPVSIAAPIPALRGPGAAIGRGWALALISAEPAHQAAAIAFLAAWMAPGTNAAWNLASDTLPTRQAALPLWDRTDPYTEFLQGQLLGAQPRPRLANRNQVEAALQQAVEAVLKGTLTPEEAAAQAMNSEK